MLISASSLSRCLSRLWHEHGWATWGCPTKSWWNYLWRQKQVCVSANWTSLVLPRKFSHGKFGGFFSPALSGAPALLLSESALPGEISAIQFYFFFFKKLSAWQAYPLKRVPFSVLKTRNTSQAVSCSKILNDFQGSCNIKQQWDR